MTSIAEWQEVARSRIRLVQDGLLATSSLRASNKTHEDLIEMMEQPYRDMLEELYAIELPLAKLVDESDLLVRLNGPAASAPSPKVSVLAKALTGTRDQVTKLAKQLGGIFAQRVPASLDMNFVGLARGSLFIGFAASDIGDDAPLTQRAVKLIGQASALVARDATLNEIASVFEDPAERDIAVDAIRQLSPSGRAGLNEVTLSGRSMKGHVELTTQTRRHARMLMSQPVAQLQGQVDFAGTIREVDLDEHRFDLRNIDGYQYDIRCAHEIDEADVKALMGKRIRVRGKAELGKQGEVRLLWVDEVEELR